MKIFNKIKIAGLMVLSIVLMISSCNKAPLPAEPIAQPLQGTTPTLATLLDNPDMSFTFLKAAIIRAGLLPTLSVPTLRFTIFAPNNAAFMASGIPSIAVINSLPVESLAGLLSYHIIPQTIVAGSIPTTFPNFEYPSILNPTGTSTTPGYNPFVRLTNFPSRRGSSGWVNNIPITAFDIPAVNGVLHTVAALIAPPSIKSLWDTISNSSNLTFFKAAIQRADSGVADAGKLQTALSTFGANLTVLAPTDAAVQQFLAASITQALIPLVVQQLIPIITNQLIMGGVTPANAALQAPAIAAAQAPAIAQGQATALSASPAVFSNPLLYGSLTAQSVRGIVVYHILGNTIPGIRVFTVNIPTTATAVKTLLNQAIPPHPGLMLQATFTGPFVTAATVKGAANPTAANFVFPADIHMLNGILHRVDQLLRPQ